MSRIGCLTGVFDLFHVGHVDVLERARRVCDRLVVGVLTDEWAMDAWGARPFVPLLERVQIVEHLRCVDEVVAVDGVRPEWLTGVLGVQTMFAASRLDGVLGVEELDGIPAELITVLPLGRDSRSHDPARRHTEVDVAGRLDPRDPRRCRSIRAAEDPIDERRVARLGQGELDFDRAHRLVSS